jgi:hypothetical protein
MPSPISVASREPDAELEHLWSAEGPGRAGFVSIPAVDPEGQIWAASSFENVFMVFDRDGTYIESWGEPGAGEGQFRLESGGNGYGTIAFGQDGGFYVADPGNARIQQFDADREFVRAWGSFGTGDGQFVLPHVIELDGEGNVYVLDDERDDVQVFDPEGEHLRNVGESVGPYMTVDDDGTVFGVDNDRGVLFEFAPDGQVRMAIDISEVVPFATGIDIHSSGDVLVSGSDTGGSEVRYLNLIRLGRDGTLRNVWPHGGEAVTVDPAGDRVYATYTEEDIPAVQAYALPAD